MTKTKKLKRHKKWPVPKMDTHCHKRFRRHNFTIRNYFFGDHLWKVCEDCGSKRRTHHVSCHPVCWGGPGI